MNEPKTERSGNRPLPGEVLLCAIKKCPNPAPGLVVVRGKIKGYKRVIRNVCDSCIAKIRRDNGVE